MYLHKLKIGDVELDNNIILAPMAGITDKAFRIICKEFGPRFSLYWNGKLKSNFSWWFKNKEIIKYRQWKKTCKCSNFW